MKHSQQPSIDILKKRIEKEFDWHGKAELEACLEDIIELPQEPTTDELLEEIGASIHQMQDGSNEWKAFKSFDCFDEYREAYGKTPREALLALREKLSVNQK